MMSVQRDSNNGHPSLSGRLVEALRKANEGGYDEALDLVEEIKAADPRNIYLIAFHRQIQKLRDLEHDHAPSSPDQRREILQSIPAVFERAVESARQREQENSGLPGIAKTEALEELKREFLKRADKYLEVGDYDHALAEIRRANIIQPDNTDAHLYEQRIEQIVALQHPVPEEPRPMYAPAEEESPAKETLSAGGGAEPSTADETSPPRFWIAAATLAALVVAGSLYLHLTGTEEGSGTTSENVKPATQHSPVPREDSADRRVNDVRVENIPIIPPGEQTPGGKNEGSGENSGSGESDRKIVAEVGAIEPAEALVPEGKETAAGALLASQRLPSLIRFATPSYPESARMAKLQGEVKLRVQISPEGKPIQVRIVDSTNPQFNEAAIEAIMKSEFSPGMMPKGPVTSWITIPIHFKRQ
jgi:TonB family protein